MSHVRVVAVTALGLLAVACQSAPAPFAPGEGPAAAGRATLTFQIAWPVRTTQTIPFSANVLRVEVLKGTAIVAQQAQRRFPSPTAQFTLQLNADTGLTVEADAFNLPNVTLQNGVPVIPAGAVPVATAQQTGVTLAANQRTAMTLSLLPAFIPQIGSIAPTNGGPGVTVTLRGSFGDVSPYSVHLAGNTCATTFLNNQTLLATIGPNSVTGTWTARADGVFSPATGSFQVLRVLNLQPFGATTSVGSTLSFAVPTGFDTSNATVSNPTLTSWAVVDPTTAGTTSVGAVSSGGGFTALATGTAQIQVFSGILMATASVTVQ